MHEPGLGDRAWWRVHGRRFALPTGVTATGVVTAGWLTDLRDVMHGALLTFATAALLPFVIIAAGVAMIALTGLSVAVAAASGGDIDPTGPAEAGVCMIEDGARIAPRYYRFLSRRKPAVRRIHAATELLQLARVTRPLGERLARVDAMRCQR